MSCRNWTVAAAVIVAPIEVITLRVLETLDQAGESRKVGPPRQRDRNKYIIYSDMAI